MDGEELSEGGWYVAVGGTHDGLVCMPGDEVQLTRDGSEGHVQVLSSAGAEVGHIDGEAGRSIARALETGVSVRAVVNGIHGHKVGQRRMVLVVGTQKSPSVGFGMFRWLRRPR